MKRCVVVLLLLTGCGGSADPMRLFKLAVADPPPASVVMVNEFVDDGHNISESVVYLEFRISPADAQTLIDRLRLTQGQTRFANHGNIPPPDARIPWFDPTRLGPNAIAYRSESKWNLTVWFNERRDHAFVVEENY